MKIRHIIPQLRTTNLNASIAFYVAKLGFDLDFRHEDFYASIRAGDDLFHLKLVDENDPSIDFVRNGEHFHLSFEVQNAKAVAKKLLQIGVTLVQDVHDTVWGTREFVINDDQGHTLYFCERHEG